MQTAVISFDVKDTEYFKRLEEYIRLNFPRFMKIYREEETADFVITDYLNKRNSKSIITIRESDADIAKFQRASDICMELVRIIYKDSAIENEYSKTGPSILCVTSALGGAGKTRISMSLAEHAAGMGKAVIYINLDPSSTGEAKSSDKSVNGLTKLHYYLEKSSRVSGTLLKEISTVVTGGSYDCIVNVKPAPDCIIGPDTAEKLIEAALSDEFHDLIILDVPSFLSDSLIKLLQGSTKGVLITGKETTQREKNFIDYLSTHCSDNLVMVRNRCRDIENSIPQDDKVRPGEQFSKAISGIYRFLEV